MFSPFRARPLIRIQFRMGFKCHCPLACYCMQSQSQRHKLRHSFQEKSVDVPKRLVVISRRFPCLYQRSGRQFCHISYVNGGFFLFLLASPGVFRLTPSSIPPTIGIMKNHRIPHTYSSSESRVTDFHLC